MRTAPSAPLARNSLMGCADRSSAATIIPPSCNGRRIVPAKPRSGLRASRNIAGLRRGSAPKQAQTRSAKPRTQATNTPHRRKPGRRDRSVRTGIEPWRSLGRGTHAVAPDARHKPIAQSSCHGLRGSLDQRTRLLSGALKNVSRRRMFPAPSMLIRISRASSGWPPGASPKRRRRARQTARPISRNLQE